MPLQQQVVIAQETAVQRGHGAHGGHKSAGFVRRVYPHVDIQFDVSVFSVELGLGVYGIELRCQSPRRFAGAEEQDSAYPQRKMEHGNGLFLRNGHEVDEHVAAGDEIHFGERRIADDVMRCKDHHAAQFRADAERVF